MKTGDLNSLRAEIERLDREMLDLIARRLEIVHEIGTLKSDLKLPIRDYRVEREVVRRMHDRCNDLGMDPAIGHLLAKLLIRSAVRSQEGLREKSHTGTLRRVLIVGGGGRMGQWFCRYLDSMEHRVTVFDPGGPVEGYAYEHNLELALGEAEMILLSTPLGSSSEILGDIITHRPRGVIFDICSLKSHLLEHIYKATKEGLRITSLHPMFGPRIRTLMDRNVILCRCGSPEADRKVKELFEETSANLIEMEISEHDEWMAYVLGMSHAVNLIFTDMLVRSGKPFSDLLKVASTTFSKQIKTTQDVSFEAADLYYEIQTLNRHTADVFDFFLEAAKDVHRAVTEGDQERFREIMDRGRLYFDKWEENRS